MDLGPFVNPNLASFGQFFIIKTKLFRFICEPIMPMTWWTRYDKLENCCLWFDHQSKGLNGSIGIAIFLKINNSTLMDSNVTSLVQENDPNTLNSSST